MSVLTYKFCLSTYLSQVSSGHFEGTKVESPGNIIVGHNGRIAASLRSFRDSWVHLLLPAYATGTIQENGGTIWIRLLGRYSARVGPIMRIKRA